MVDDDDDKEDDKMASDEMMYEGVFVRNRDDLESSYAHMCEEASSFIMRKNRLDGVSKSRQVASYPSCYVVGIEVNQDFLRSAKQEDVDSDLALDQNFFVRYFGFVRLFLANFFHVSKGSALQFFDILQQNGCSKNPKGSPETSMLCDLPETSISSFLRG